MRLSKSRKILLTILLTCVMVVCIAFGTVSTAFAARTVTMTGSNFFYANDGAKIYAYEDVPLQLVDEVDEDKKPTGNKVEEYVKHNYTMFYMTDGDDNVTYRYNLAYHWFAAQTDEDKLGDSCSDSGDYSEGDEGWFSMVIGFNPSFVNATCDNFDTITIAFQSQQYTKTEDSVTTNYITFVNNKETDPEKAGVYVIITDDEEETKVTKDDMPEDAVLLHTMNGTQGTGDVGNTQMAARITIEFTGYGVPEYDEETKELISSHNGEYSVKVSSDAGEVTDEDGNVTGNTEEVEGYFKNVGGNYSKRVNSTTAGVMPLTFSATFDDANRKGDDKTDDSEGTGETGGTNDAEGGEEGSDEEEPGTGAEGESESEEETVVDENLPNECGMVLFELNGQSFEYSDAESTEDTYYKNGDVVISGSTVNDNAPPVLCLETNIEYLTYGQTLSFDYTVVDVLASSPKSEISYYVLTADQYIDTSLNYNLVEDEEADEDDGTLSDAELEASLAKSPFTLTTDDNRLLIETDIPYLPSDIVDANKDAAVEGGTGCTVECLAKVCILLTDITSSAGNNKTTYVMLDWYVSDVVTVEGPEDAETNADETGHQGNFIKVVKDSQGLTYGYFTEDGAGNDAKYTYSQVMNPDAEHTESTFTYNYYDEALAAEYQEEVDKLARDGQEYLLTAGSTSYFYLPEYNGFMGDNLDGYENLTFSIYYDVNGEQGSNTGLAYNALAISLGSEGKYTFTVYATDSSSNKMYYIDVKDGTDEKTGNEYVTYELKEFEGSDIYDDEDLMAMLPWFTFEVVYFGATIDDPETPSTGFVGTTYTDISFTINGISSYYETAYQLYEFDTAAYMEDVGKTYYSYEEFAEDMEELFTSGGTRKYFKEILNYADLNENDDKYEEMSEYEWDSDALSFIPQNSDAFYMVRLTVTDTRRNVGNEVKSYLAVHVSAESSEFRGESDWARNNVVSIVLFCVAGVALIGIILVFAIRPKDQGDIDEQLSKQTEKAKAKAERKKKK